MKEVFNWTVWTICLNHWVIVNVTSAIDPVAVCFSADLFLMSHKQTFKTYWNTTRTFIGENDSIVKCIGDILTMFLHITAKH